MDRREMLGVLGVGAAGLLATAGTAEAQAENRARYKSLLDQTHVDCLNACTQCAAVCNEASHHCLEQLKLEKADRPRHYRAHHFAMDCATMCATGAALVARQSPLMAEQCNACSEACKKCAEACDHDPEGAQIMQECVRICQECERACREMVRAMGGTHGTHH